MKSLEPGSYFQQLSSRIGGAQVNYHFNVSLKNRYLYVQTSKCACTFIKAGLTRFELGDLQYFDDHYRHTKHANVIQNALQNGPHQTVNRAVFVKPYQLGERGFDALLDDQQYFKFAMVRNPYSRVLSAFLDTIIDRRPPLLNLLPELAELMAVTPRQALTEQVSFKQFLLALQLKVERFGWGAVDQHFRQLHFHLSDDIISYSKLYKVEELDQFERDFAERHGQPFPKVQRGAHTKSAKSQLASYYDQSCRALVAGLYKEDLERFGYKFAL